MPYRINARPAQASEPAPVVACAPLQVAGWALQLAVFAALLGVTMLCALMALLCIVAVF